MSVESIGSISNAAPVSPLQARPQAPVQDTPPPDSGGVSVEISRAGKNQQALDDLAQKDPTAFKEKTGEIAKQLQALADAGGPGANFAAKLADRFKQASESGDATALHGHHGHHKHHHAVDATSTAEASGASSDKQVQEAYKDDGSRAAAFEKIQGVIDGVLNGSK